MSAWLWFDSRGDVTVVNSTNLKSQYSRSLSRQTKSAGPVKLANDFFLGNAQGIQYH